MLASENILFSLHVRIFFIFLYNAGRISHVVFYTTTKSNVEINTIDEDK